MYTKFLAFTALLLLAGAYRLFAQDQQPASNDTIPLIGPDSDSLQIGDEPDTIPETNGLSKPQRAAAYAAILPGLGQIYNKKYWKLPILYGGGAVTGYYVYWLNQKYQQYREAYLQKKSLPANQWTNPLAQAARSEDVLQGRLEIYRKWRDQAMIYMAGIYLIQIVDAYVDAHLMNFDISEDLSLHLGPDIRPNVYTPGNQYGVKFSLTFN